MKNKTRVEVERKSRLMTQYDLAKRSNLSLRTICSIENGRPCNMRSKRKILSAFGIMVEDQILSDEQIRVLHVFFD